MCTLFCICRCTMGSILATNIIANKRPPKKINRNALATYWNEYGMLKSYLALTSTSAFLQFIIIILKYNTDIKI